MPVNPEKQVSLRAVLTVGMIVFLGLAWLVWSQWDRLRGVAKEPAVETSLDAVATDADSVATAAPADTDEARLRWTALLGRSPQWPDDLSSPAECSVVEADLARICAVLTTVICESTL